MNKDEILQKSKQAGVDERVEKIEADSSNWGLITVLVLVIFFGTWNWIRGIKSFDLVAIFAGYITTISFYKFKMLGVKKFLTSGILGAASAIAGIIAFFLAA